MAERSVYAHQIGWYQVDVDAGANLGYTVFRFLPSGGGVTNTSLCTGDLVWVTGRRLGGYNDYADLNSNLAHTYAPVINPYTGQTQYLVNRDIRPVRG